MPKMFFFNLAPGELTDEFVVPRIQHGLAMCLRCQVRRIISVSASSWVCESEGSLSLLQQLDLQEQAAVRIQAAFRGYLVRKYINFNQCAGSDRLQR